MATDYAALPPTPRIQALQENPMFKAMAAMATFKVADGGQTGALIVVTVLALVALVFVLAYFWNRFNDKRRGAGRQAVRHPD